MFELPPPRKLGWWNFIQRCGVFWKKKKKIPGTILARMQGLGFAILACFCKLHDLPLTVESGVVVALGKDGNMVIRDGVRIQHMLEKHFLKNNLIFNRMLGWCSLWMRKKGKHPMNSRNEIHPPSGDADEPRGGRKACPRSTRLQVAFSCPSPCWILVTINNSTQVNQGPRTCLVFLYHWRTRSTSKGFCDCWNLVQFGTLILPYCSHLGNKPQAKYGLRLNITFHIAPTRCLLQASPPFPSSKFPAV